MQERQALSSAATRGVTYLLLGKLVSYLIGFVGSLLVIRLLGAFNYGSVSVAMIVPGIFASVGDLGMSFAVTKFAADSKSSAGEAYQAIANGLLFDLAFAASATALALLSAGWIVTVLFRKPEVASLANLAALATFATIMYQWGWAAFLGLEDTKVNGFMMIVYYVVQSIVQPTLVYAGLGPEGAVIGYILAPLSGALIAAGFIAKKRAHLAFNAQVLKRMFAYGVPLAISLAAASVTQQVYNLLIGAYASTIEIGNYFATSRFTIVVDILLSPFTTMLLPVFSRVQASEKGRMRIVFEDAIRYSTILIVPAALLTIVLARPVTQLLFGTTYQDAWFYLSLIAIGWLFSGTGVYLIGQAFAGQGDSKLWLEISLAGNAVGLVLAFLLIPTLGITGFLLASLLSVWPQYFLSLRIARQRYHLAIPTRAVLKIYLAGVVAVAPVYLLTRIYLSSLLEVLLGLVITALLYLVAIARSRAITREDVDFLREQMSLIPIVGGLFAKFLSLVRRLLPHDAES